jgi:hypothetical protein
MEYDVPREQNEFMPAKSSKSFFILLGFDHAANKRTIVRNAPNTRRKANRGQVRIM